MAFQRRGEIEEDEVPDNDRRKTRRLHGRDAGLQAANRKAAVFHAVLIVAVVHVMQGAGGLRLVHCGFGRGFAMRGGARHGGRQQAEKNDRGNA